MSLTVREKMIQEQRDRMAEIAAEEQWSDETRIGRARRAAEWWTERSQEAQAVELRVCSLCGSQLAEDGREADWMRCVRCGHLAFAGSRARRLGRLRQPSNVKRRNRKECRA